jgi:hypothetical protein
MVNSCNRQQKRFDDFDREALRRVNAGASEIAESRANEQSRPYS